MEVARLAVANGSGHGTVVTADFQTDGRGRHKDRKWSSKPAQNLLCTIVFEQSRLDVPAQRIPLLLGLGVSRTLERITHRMCAIKWPNDVLIDERKIAGVLCESDEFLVYAGVGINCNQDQYPEDLRRPAISIREVIDEPVEIGSVLETFLEEVASVFMNESWKSEIESCLVYRGCDVRIVTGLQSQVYRLRGIGLEGELVVEGDDGEHRFFAGEIELEL